MTRHAPNIIQSDKPSSFPSFPLYFALLNSTYGRCLVVLLLPVHLTTSTVEILWSLKQKLTKMATLKAKSSQKMSCHVLILTFRDFSFPRDRPRTVAWESPFSGCLSQFTFLLTFFNPILPIHTWEEEFFPRMTESPRPPPAVMKNRAISRGRPP